MSSRCQKKRDGKKILMYIKDFSKIKRPFSSLNGVSVNTGEIWRHFKTPKPCLQANTGNRKLFFGCLASLRVPSAWVQLGKMKGGGSWRGVRMKGRGNKRSGWLSRSTRRLNPQHRTSVQHPCDQTARALRAMKIPKGRRRKKILFLKKNGTAILLSN